MPEWSRRDTRVQTLKIMNRHYSPERTFGRGCSGGRAAFLIGHGIGDEAERLAQDIRIAQTVKFVNQSFEHDQFALAPAKE